MTPVRTPKKLIEVALPLDAIKYEKLLITEELTGARGLAEDVRRYGAWMRAEAEKRIGYLYPPIEITADMALERPDLFQYSRNLANAN